MAKGYTLLFVLCDGGARKSMGNVKGLRNIPSTIKSIRTGLGISQKNSYDIFSELAILGREKQRLNTERAKWLERIEQIELRLKEIEEKETDLLRKEISTSESLSFLVTDGKNVKEDIASESEMVLKY
jgi:hypothetical protein